jgi:hypothetical protein
MATNLHQELRRIKERNARVEVDKAWETSVFRKVIIAAFTYFVMVVFFYSAELPRPWVNSIVPSLAFIISTLSMPFFKRLWLRLR